MCSKCEAIKYMNIDSEQCGKRVHVFWEDTIGKFMEYLRLSRTYAHKIYVLSHNSRGYDTVSVT